MELVQASESMYSRGEILLLITLRQRRCESTRSNRSARDRAEWSSSICRRRNFRVCRGSRGGTQVSLVTARTATRIAAATATPRIGVRTDKQAAATNQPAPRRARPFPRPAPAAATRHQRHRGQAPSKSAKWDSAARRDRAEVEDHRERDPGDEERDEGRGREGQPFEGAEMGAHNQAQTGRNRQASMMASPAALSRVGVSQRPFVRCRAKSARPHPSSATEMR